MKNSIVIYFYSKKLNTKVSGLAVVYTSCFNCRNHNV